MTIEEQDRRKGQEWRLLQEKKAERDKLLEEVREIKEVAQGLSKFLSTDDYILSQFRPSWFHNLSVLTQAEEKLNRLSALTQEIENLRRNFPVD